MLASASVRPNSWYAWSESAPISFSIYMPIWAHTPSLIFNPNSVWVGLSQVRWPGELRSSLHNLYRFTSSASVPGAAPVTSTNMAFIASATVANMVNRMVDHALFQCTKTWTGLVALPWFEEYNDTVSESESAVWIEADQMLVRWPVTLIQQDPRTWFVVVVGTIWWVDTFYGCPGAMSATWLGKL